MLSISGLILELTGLEIRMFCFITEIATTNLLSSEEHRLLPPQCYHCLKVGNRTFCSKI